VPIFSVSEILRTEALGWAPAVAQGLQLEQYFGRTPTPWVAELRTACERARAHLHDRELVAGMKHKTVISQEGQEGENVLLQLMKQAVKFRCRNVFTRLVFKQMSRGTGQNFQEAK